MSDNIVSGKVVMPRHIAIVMDGNGRWAKKRFLPRVAGHAKGVEAIRRTIEVGFLMNLFLSTLEKETDRLDANNIRLNVIGDISRFDSNLQEAIARAQDRTSANTALTLTVCANYGGRWDMLQAVRRMSQDGIGMAEMTEKRLASYLALSYAPDPELFIRTGGEKRISNFLLWQLAYTELYFTDIYWPDFDDRELEKAILSFKSRERRFGKTSEQLVI